MLKFHVFAYLDPATGSTLFQLAIASVLTTLATLRLYWSRLRSFCGRRSTNYRSPPASDS
jgi:hypothetical protein